MNRTEKSVIQWECQQLLNRVMNLTDSTNWEALAACYAEEAMLFRPSDPETAIIGRKEIYQSFLGRPPRVTCHLLTNLVFDVLSETEVRATSRVLLCAGEPKENGPALADSKILIGSFVDDLSLVDEEWLISLRRGSVELKYNP